MPTELSSVKSEEFLTDVVAFIVTAMLTCPCFVGHYLQYCSYPTAGSSASRFPDMLPSELPQHQLGKSIQILKSRCFSGCGQVVVWLLYIV